MLTLPKRTAVITGAANGVGRALAMCAASRGMSLALADIDESALNAVRKSLPSETQVLVEVLDVRDRSAQDAFASSVFERFGSVALVFANAGVMRAGTTWQLDPADWDAVFDINVKGVVHTASAFMPTLSRMQIKPNEISLNVSKLQQMTPTDGSSVLKEMPQRLLGNQSSRRRQHSCYSKKRSANGWKLRTPSAMKSKSQHAK